FPPLSLNVSSSTLIETLSLHDALPILEDRFPKEVEVSIYTDEETDKSSVYKMLLGDRYRSVYSKPIKVPVATLDTLYGGLEVMRSEEHTSELQSRENLVCRLLLEKKNI